MSARVEEMRWRERAGELLDSLIAVFLIGIVSGIGLAFVVRTNQTIVPQVLQAATSAALGLVTGMVARLALRGASGALRAAAALAALGMALYFVGWFSGEQAGLALRRLARPVPDWGGLLQLSLGALSALLALRAWPRKEERVQVARAPSRAQAVGASARDQGAAARFRPTRRGQAGVAVRGSRGTQANGVAGRVPPSGQTRPAAHRLHSLWARLSSWPRQLHLPEVFLRRRRRVRLVGAEQYRCPYCLEPVGRADPRGVVACRVCHARHHADCWEVTETCQVPHYHT